MLNVVPVDGVARVVLYCAHLTNTTTLPVTSGVSPAGAQDSHPPTGWSSCPGVLTSSELPCMGPVELTCLFALIVWFLIPAPGMCCPLARPLICDGGGQFQKLLVDLRIVWLCVEYVYS